MSVMELSWIEWFPDIRFCDKKFRYVTVFMQFNRISETL